jgi:hypothetical protein
MTQGQTFATRERELRVDATLDGVRMGSEVAGGLGGTRELALDLAVTGATTASPGVRDGQSLQLQVLGPGPAGMPAVHGLFEVRLGEVSRRAVDLPGDAAWVFLRIADLSRANDTPGPPGHPGNARAVAYCSPWWSER